MSQSEKWFYFLFSSEWVFYAYTAILIVIGFIVSLGAVLIIRKQGSVEDDNAKK